MRGPTLIRCSTVVVFLLVMRNEVTGLSLTRREVVNSAVGSAFLVCSTTTSAFAVEDVVDEPRNTIQQTITGVKYRDERIGKGPSVANDDVIVMHLSGQTRDGNIIVDTRQRGRPLLHKLGSAIDTNFFGSGKSNQRPIVVTGIEDGIRGMKEGGIRRLVIPSPLGYGHAGVSRYDAMGIGLQNPVPRDELLAYEVEILRCIDVPIPINDENGSTDSPSLVAQACCSEPDYPCKIPDNNTSKSNN